MAWKKVDPEQARRLELALAEFEADQRQMFGCPAYFVPHNSIWFSGVHEDNILVRLSEADQAELADQHREAKKFEPMPGRVMKEFIILPPSVTEDEAEFKTWLGKAHAYSAGLPPKKKKAKKKTK